MAWLRSPNLTNEQVSVNTKVFDFKHSLVQVEDPEDIRIFQEYLHCEIVPDEMVQSLIAEAEGAAKETVAETEKETVAKTRKAKGAEPAKG
jgi:hypothetical protein